MSKKTISVAALASVLLICSELHASSPDATNQRESDFEALKNQLESRYSNLSWIASFESGVNLPSLEKSTHDAVLKSSTDEEFRVIVSNFVSSFKDGHLKVLSPAIVSPNDPPIADIENMDAKTACAALGFEPAPHISFSLPFESLQGFRLEDDGLTSVFRTGVWTNQKGEKIGLVRIPRIRSQSYPALCVNAWPSAKSKGNQSSIKNYLADLWFLALHDSVNNLASKGINSLLIDVGDNPGGDNGGDVAARIFTKKPVNSQQLLVSYSPGSDDYLDSQISRLQDGVKLDQSKATQKLLNDQITLLSEAKATPKCDMRWVWHEQRHWKQIACRQLRRAGSSGGPLSYLSPQSDIDKKVSWRLSWALAEQNSWGAWDGKTYLLTDGKTYSAAELFTATMHDNGIAKTIGEKTGGDGCGFMSDDDPIVLPYSKLRIQIPNCTRLRADGSNEVAGIKPDLPIAPVSNKRAQAAKVLELISQ